MNNLIEKIKTEKENANRVSLDDYVVEEEETKKGVFLTPKDIFLGCVILATVTVALFLSSLLILTFWEVIK